LGTYDTERRQKKTEDITEFLNADLQQPHKKPRDWIQVLAGVSSFFSYRTLAALLVYIVKFGNSRVGDRGKN
jgi:hypothetical protein